MHRHGLNTVAMLYAQRFHFPLDCSIISAISRHSGGLAMKVVAIAGSPHIKGNTSYLVDEALKELEARGIETEKISLAERAVAPCQGHDKCSTYKACKIKDDAPEIIRKYNAADGVILASPVYFFDVTAQMKAFIDRNFFTYTHEGKKKAKCAGLIAIGGGGGADETINTLKAFTGLPDEDVFTLAGYTGEGESKDKPQLVKKARELGRKMAARLKK
jgi:multimeric flavodoxin WrbA